MKNSIATTFIIIFTFLLVPTGKPQTLSLFEELDDNGSDTLRARRNRAAEDSNGNRSAIEFTLLGTSNIGGHFSVMIMDNQGETLRIAKPSGSDIAIPNHPGYILTKVEANRVSVRYPEDIPCIASKENKISCSDINTAVLTLANRDPLIRSSEAGNSSESNELQEDEPAVNPFEALRASRENAAGIDSDATANNGRFRPRRIDPNDVPPGMRVISTPFGDRLVEQ